MKNPNYTTRDTIRTMMFLCALVLIMPFGVITYLILLWRDERRKKCLAD